MDYFGAGLIHHHLHAYLIILLFLTFHLQLLRMILLILIRNLFCKIHMPILRNSLGKRNLTIVFIFICL